MLLKACNKLLRRPMWCSGNWEHLTLALSGVLEGRMAWMFHKSSQTILFSYTIDEKDRVFNTFCVIINPVGIWIRGDSVLVAWCCDSREKSPKFSAQRSQIYKSFKKSLKKGMSASPVLKIKKEHIKAWLDLVDFLISSTESWSKESLKHLKLKGNDINY